MAIGWTLEEYKTLAEIAQAVVLSFAAVAGGLWALHRYRILKEEETADTNLRATQLGLLKTQGEVADLQRKLLARRTLNLAVAATSMRGPSGSYLVVRAKARNIGNHTETLLWEKGGVHTARVAGVMEGAITLGPWLRTRLQFKGIEADATPVAPGETKHFLFLVPIELHGLYRVCVEVPCSAPEAAAALQLAGVRTEGAEVMWAVETLVRVDPPPLSPSGGSTE